MTIVWMLIYGLAWGLIFAGIPAAAIMAGLLHLGYFVGGRCNSLVAAVAAFLFAICPLIVALYGAVSLVINTGTLVPEYRDGYQIYILMGAGLAALGGAAISFIYNRKKLGLHREKS